MHENLTLNETVAGTTVAGVRDLYDIDFDGTFSTVIVSPPQTALSRDVIIDLAGYRQPHVDELVIGYRRQLPGRTTVDVNATRREYRNRPALVETNARYEGRTFAGYTDESRNEIYRLTSNTWNRPVLTALQASVSRDTSRLQLIAGYTRSWNRLDGSWLPGDPASFIQPDAFPNRHGIGFITGCTSGGVFCPDSNSFSTGFGGGTWRDHLFNAGAAYQGPWGVRIAASHLLQSGPWSGPIQTRLEAPDPQFGPPTIALSNGRLVSNPLATLIRFAYPTRAEGQLRLGALHLLNVRIGRRFRAAGRLIDVAVDVLNATNSGADQAFQPGAQQRFSPFFGQGAVRQFPRAAKISLRVAF